jgi:hypothetical protein
MQAEHPSRDDSTRDRQRVAVRTHTEPHTVAREVEGWQAAVFEPCANPDARSRRSPR